MKEKRGEEENPLVEEEKEQEHKRIEGDIKKLGEQKWYLKSKSYTFFALLRRQLVICMFSYFVKMTEGARRTYLTVATIMMALWSLKFLPPYVLAITVVVVACLLFIVKL